MTPSRLIRKVWRCLYDILTCGNYRYTVCFGRDVASALDEDPRHFMWWNSVTEAPHPPIVVNYDERTLHLREFLTEMDAEAFLEQLRTRQFGYLADYAWVERRRSKGHGFSQIKVARQRVHEWMERYGV